MTVLEKLRESPDRTDPNTLGDSVIIIVRWNGLKESYWRCSDMFGSC